MPLESAHVCGRVEEGDSARRPLGRHGKSVLYDESRFYGERVVGIQTTLRQRIGGRRRLGLCRGILRSLWGLMLITLRLRQKVGLLSQQTNGHKGKKGSQREERDGKEANSLASNTNRRLIIT